MEEKDKDLLATCIRETQEETGILLDTNQLQSPLSLEPAGRNFDSPLWVQPFLFTVPKPPLLTLETKEIENSCWLDAVTFQNMDLHKEVEMLPGRIFPAYALEDYYLWGFTYRLLCGILGLDNQKK